MASLLTKWLNEDVKLSRQVEDLDNDFKDGYLIGELMARFNQQADFALFLQNGTADAKIKNFCLLEPTMNRIGVHYNSRIAQDIMNSKPGVMKTLLYEIRTACDTMSKIVHSVGSNQKILRVIQPSREKFDKTKSVTFENAVRTASENPNEVMMARATERFQDKKFQFRDSVSRGHTESVDEFVDERKRFKEIQQQKKKHEREFHQAWELKNKEQWQKNQTVAHDRRKLEHAVSSRAKTKEHNVRVSAQNDARAATLKGIDDFEMHMKNRLFTSVGEELVENSDNTKTSMLKIAGGAAGTGVPELMYLDEQVLTANLIHAQKTIKEHHKDLLVSQKEHGRRRNKYVRGVESKRIQQLQRVVEESMMSQLLTPSRSELGDDKKRDQVVNYVNVMRDNRTHRDVLLDEVRNVDAYREAQWASEQVQREIYWTINLRMASQIHRDQMYSESMTFADRFYTVAAITEEVERILNVVDWIISVREFAIINNNNLGEDPPRLTSNERPGTAGVDEEVDGKHIVSQSIAAQLVLDEEAGSILLPQVMWRTIIAMYLSSFPIAKALTFPMPFNVYETLPYSLSHQPFCVDSKELIDNIFTGNNVFAYDGKDVIEEDGENPLFVAEKTSAGDLSIFLAGAECSHGVSCLANDSDYGGHLPPDVKPKLLEYVPPKEPYVAGDGGPEDVKAQAEAREHRIQHNKMVMSPNWLFDTPPKYLFGQILLDVSCTSDPLPVAPMPAVSSRSDYTMPLRIALTGMSDVARKTTAHMLRDKYNLALINIDNLISRAMDRYRNDVDSTEELDDNVYDDNMLLSEYYARNSKLGARAALFPAATSPTGKPSLSTRNANAAILATTACGESISPNSLVDGTEFAEEKERLLVSYIGRRLLKGKILSDDVYVALIVAKIQKIQDCCNTSIMFRSQSVESFTEIPPLELPLGFVVEDFPNTKRQALLLFEALSGFDYSKSLPQPVDRASVYAPTVPCERVDYDVSKCGLDMIYYFDTESSNNVLYERLNARQKTVPVAWDAVPTAGEPLLPHVETVYMTNQMTTTQHLEDLYTPSRPVETSSLAIHADLKAASAYKEFLMKMGLMRHKVVNGFDEFDTLGKEIVKELRDDIPKDVLHMYPEEQEVVEEVIIAAVEDEGPMLAGVMRSFSRGSILKTVKSGQSDPGGQVPTLERPVSVPDRNPAALAAVISQSEDQGDFELVGHVCSEEVVENVIPDMVSIPALLPKNLAVPLATIWQTAEKQSFDVNCNFNSALCDIRYQMLQRRRCLFDGVYSFITMHDEKQNVMEDFRTQFNTIDNDLRFDVACIAEFHLRALEMKNTFWDLALERRQAADAYLSEKGHDSQIPIFIHRSHCEGAALVESELHRFYATLHILFDYMKSMVGFDYLETVHNKMEDVVEVADDSRPLSNAASSKPAKGKLSKDKSVKVGKKDLPPADAPVPFRIPYSTGILPSTMEQLPVAHSPQESEAQKPPAKKAAKGKKDKEEGDDVSGLNPMEFAIKSATEASAMYTSESFKVNRSLYEDEEAMCTVLENVIWFETKKFHQSLANIKHVVNTQVGWLQFMEHDITKMLRKIIADQQTRELAAGERVVQLAQQSIDACEPICVEWLIAPDALAVCPNRLIIPAFVPPPPPVVEEVFDNVFNENQFQIVAKKIMSLKHHNSVLFEDFASWLQRSCNSSVSPQSCTTTSLFKSVGGRQDPSAMLATFNSTAFPINWRVNTDHCMNAILEQYFVAGTCTFGGYMVVDVVLEKLRQYRGYHNVEEEVDAVPVSEEVVALADNI